MRKKSNLQTIIVSLPLALIAGGSVMSSAMEEGNDSSIDCPHGQNIQAYQSPLNFMHSEEMRVEPHHKRRMAYSSN